MFFFGLFILSVPFFDIENSRGTPIQRANAYEVCNLNRKRHLQNNTYNESLVYIDYSSVARCDNRSVVRLRRNYSSILAEQYGAESLFGVHSASSFAHQRTSPSLLFSFIFVFALRCIFAERKKMQKVEEANNRDNKIQKSLYAPWQHEISDSKNNCNNFKCI